MKLNPEETMNRIMARLSPTSSWLAKTARVSVDSMWCCLAPK